MSQEFEAKTLEEVYEKAASSLKCSITDLDIDIIQAPSKGFLGFFAKNAIISVTLKHSKNKHKTKQTPKEHIVNTTAVETLSSKLNALKEEENTVDKYNVETSNIQQIQKEKIFDEFYNNETQKLHETPQINPKNNTIVQEIKTEVNTLFSKLCYKIDEIEVAILDDNKTVYIEFKGEDSALLIGKEGYRYKAISYILFNWLNEKYNMMLRLEVAQFLENQESAIYTYLEPVIETIHAEGFYKTKPLDGILVHIALTKLRDEFPDKYVAVKTNPKGERYILVNEYRN